MVTPVALNLGPGYAESSSMTRHCPRCATEVEDRGGYCALGHRLRLGSIDGSINDLRAEIDQVFEAARLEVSGVLQGAPPPPPAANDVTPAVEDDIPSTEVYRERARGVWAVLEEDNSIEDDPIEAFAPPPRMDWGPKRSAIFHRFSHPRRPSSAAV
jgi:hypothetical protein